jgi:hypothetical protein
MDTFDDEDGEDDDDEQGVEGGSNFRRKGVWCVTPRIRAQLRLILKEADEADDEEDEEVEVAILDEMHSRRLARRGRGPGTQHMLNLMRG